jgi:hypothetical protein
VYLCRLASPSLFVPHPLQQHTFHIPQIPNLVHSHLAPVSDGFFDDLTGVYQPIQLVLRAHGSVVEHTVPHRSRRDALKRRTELFDIAFCLWDLLVDQEGEAFG